MGTDFLQILLYVLGAGLLLYIICIFIIPMKPDANSENKVIEEKNKVE